MSDREIVDAINELRRDLSIAARGGGASSAAGGAQLNLERTQRLVLATLMKMAKIRETDVRGLTRQFSKLYDASDALADSIDHEHRVRTETARREERERQGRSNILSRSINKFKELIKGTTDEHAKSKDFFGGSRNRLRSTVDAISGDLTEGLRPLGKLFEYGAPIAIVVETIARSVDIYRQLNEVGQGFNGSILNMEQAAASAGLPLTTFAEAIKKNSVAVALLNGGATGFGAMYKTVRKNIEFMGEYGLTLEQGAEYFGNYLETQRLTGQLSVRNEQELTTGFTSLLDEVDKVSKATGVQRSLIMEQVNQFERNPNVFGILNSFPPELQGQLKGTIDKVSARFASIPGDTGKELLDMIGQSMPLGSVLFTETGRNMNQFAGELRAGLDNLMRTMQDGGDVDQAMDAVSESALALSKDTQRIGQLARLSAAGVPGMRETLKIIQELSAAEEARQKNANQPRNLQNATKALLDFQTVIQNAIGAIRDGFLVGFSKFVGPFNDWLGKDGPNFINMFQKLGERLGEFVGNIFTDNRLTVLGENFVKLIDLLAWTADKFISLITAVTLTIDNFENLTKNILPGWVGDQASFAEGVIAVGAGLWALLHPIRALMLPLRVLGGLLRAVGLRGGVGAAAGEAAGIGLLSKGLGWAGIYASAAAGGTMAGHGIFDEAGPDFWKSHPGVSNALIGAHDFLTGNWGSGTTAPGIVTPETPFAPSINMPSAAGGSTTSGSPMTPGFTPQAITPATDTSSMLAAQVSITNMLLQEIKNSMKKIADHTGEMAYQ